MDRYFALPRLRLPGSFVLSCLLSTLALGLAVFFQTQDRILCLAAMLFSTLGDILLMDFRGLSKVVRHCFYAGAAAFMAAHVFYLLAYRNLGQRQGFVLFNGGFWAGTALGAVVLVGFTVLTLVTRRFNPVLYAVFVVYLTLITLNCSVVFSYAVSAAATRPWCVLAAAGALSFFVSDAFIGLEKLGGISACSGLIWWFYPIGQLLLILFA